MDWQHRYCPWCREFHDLSGRNLHEDRARHPDAIYWYELGSILINDEQRRVERFEEQRKQSMEAGGEGALEEEGDQPMRTEERWECCAVCGRHSRHDHLMSLSGGGASDLDGRPARSLRHIVEYQVHRCPSCGYCAPTISEASPRAGYLVASDVYQEQLADPSLPHLAQSLLCAAMVCEAEESLSQRVLQLRLQAAWACDDGGSAEGAARCRLAVAEAIQNMERFGGHFHVNDGRADYALLADVYRRAGELDEARMWIEIAAGASRGVTLGEDHCIDYLRKLIDAGDVEAHTVEEARRWAADEAAAPASRHESGLLTAVDLLRQFVELRTLAPDLDTWNAEALAGNPPRFYRLKRLQALLRAYAIDCEAATFASGDFIDPADPRYEGAAERLAPLLGEHHLRADHLLGGPQPMLLRQGFRDLLRYRQDLESALGSTQGTLAAGGWYALAVLRMQKLNSVMGEHLWIVEDVLAAIINPDGRAFTLAELVAEHGYPDVDLRSIDEDWT